MMASLKGVRQEIDDASKKRSGGKGRKVFMLVVAFIKTNHLSRSRAFFDPTDLRAGADGVT